MFSGSPGPVMRQKARGTRPLRNRMRRIARRAVLPGYPVDPHPFTLDEVRAYYKGDRLVCLRCGKLKKRLGCHLRAIHSMTGTEYCTMYGLPYRRGLSSDEAHALGSARMKETLARTGYRPGNADTRHMAHLAAVHQRVQPFRRELSRLNLPRMNAARINKKEPKL